MSTRRKVIVGAAGVFLVVAASVVISSCIRPAEDITVAIDGEPGQELTATFVVDGVEHSETLTTPASQTLRASTLHFWIDRADGPDQPDFRVAMSMGDQSFGTAEAASPDQCAYGGLCTASLFRIRRERSYVHPAPREVVANLTTPPGFPVP